MSDGPIAPEPPRLSREDDEAAELFERAEPRYRHGLDEARAWQRVERTRRRRAVLSWAASASALVVVLAFAGTLLNSRVEPEVYALGPEPLPLGTTSEPAPADVPSGVLSEPAEPPEPAPERAPGPAVVRGAVASVEPPPSEARCKQWLSDGKPGRAVECFRMLSKNTGLDAEVALYEAARLSGDLLRDGSAALALLDEHQRRFPSSALRGEVDWLRVRSLHRTGRFDEALTESEALLATPAGRTLASELHALRGRIFQEQKRDCERALREFVALVGEPGPRGDDAELRRAECLEALGRSSDAARAYEQYLARPDARRDRQARSRLSKLRE